MVKKELEYFLKSAICVMVQNEMCFDKTEEESIEITLQDIGMTTEQYKKLFKK